MQNDKIHKEPQSAEPAAAPSLKSAALIQDPASQLVDATQAVRHEIGTLAQPDGLEALITPEKEVVNLLSQLDIPAVIRKEGEGGVTRIAELLIRLRQEGYGDYLAVYNIFSNLNSHSRKEYLELWQERKKQILQSLDEYMPSTEEFLEKYCCEGARREFTRLKKKSPQKFEQLVNSLRKMIAIARSMETLYVREMNKFRQGQKGDNFDCDEHLLLNQALSRAAGITILPELHIDEHVCQDIPETAMVLDWGNVLTKRELLQRYGSDYFATEDHYATANYDQHGKVGSYTSADNQLSCTKPNEALASLLGRQITMYEESERYNSRSAVVQVTEQLSPDARYVRNRKAYDAIKAKRVGEAIVMLEQWLEQDPENVDFLDLLARAYLQQKRVADAVGLFEIILRRYPNNASQVSDIFDILESNGAYTEARSIIERFMPKKLTSQQRAYAQHQIGYAYSKEGNLTLALQFFEKAAKLDPEEELYRRNIATIRRKI